eukprot:14169992-Alexandrium_andersonii.AAC.1
MSASLVGSEMCIRDSPCAFRPFATNVQPPDWLTNNCSQRLVAVTRKAHPCLLYTSDAADDM